MKNDAANAGPDLMKAGGSDTVVFTMASPVGPDVILEIVSSTDLILWSALATRATDGTWSGPVPVTVTPDSPGKAEISLTRASGADVQRFYDLRVTLSP